MKKQIFLPIIIFFSKIAFSQRNEECEWMTGKYGQPLECQAGWVAKGACSSGGHSACSAGIRNNYWAKLKCCHSHYDNDPQHSCVEISGNQGENLNCGLAPGRNNYLNGLYGICSSGRDADCVNETGEKVYDTAKCCESSDVIIQEEKYCSWRYGNYGEDMECPSGYMMAGFCGSGRNGQCGAGGTYTGIKCCSYVDNRQ